MPGLHYRRERRDTGQLRVRLCSRSLQHALPRSRASPQRARPAHPAQGAAPQLGQERDFHRGSMRRLPTGADAALAHTLDAVSAVVCLLSAAFLSAISPRRRAERVTFDAALLYILRSKCETACMMSELLQFSVWVPRKWDGFDDSSDDLRSDFQFGGSLNRNVVMWCSSGGAGAGGATKLTSCAATEPEAAEVAGRARHRWKQAGQQAPERYS